MNIITYHHDGTVTVRPSKRTVKGCIINRNRVLTPREIADLTHPPAVRRRIITLALASGQIRRAK